MFSRKPTTFVAVGAAAVAIAIGAFAIGSSSSSNDASGTATAAQAPAVGHGAGSGQPAASSRTFAPAGTPAGGQVPENWRAGTGTIITGEAADKAEAAALAAGYSGTPNRVLKLSDGSYAVHMFATNGPHHVFVNTDFEVTGAATGG